MEKYLKRRITGILLAITMFVTLIPVTVYASNDGLYDNGFISMNVDYQDYYYSDYIAYTNHSFDCTFENAYYTDADFKVSFNDQDFTKYVTIDSSKISMSIPKEILSQFEAGKSYKIVYGFYQDDEPINVSVSQIKIENPHYIYNVHSGDGDVYVNYYALMGQLSSIGTGTIYDWEHPYGDDCDQIKATSVDVINDAETPNAFVNESHDDYVSVTTKKPGHAIVNVYYSKIDGYVDDNKKGYCSLEYNAKEELVDISIKSTLDHNTVIAGDKFDLKATAVSYIMLENRLTNQETERNISYDWSSDISKNKGFSYEVDKKDPSICHITVEDVSINETINMYLTYSYIDSSGKYQTNAGNEIQDQTSYEIKLAKYGYRIDCELPDEIETGDTVTLKPVLKKVTANGESVVPNAGFWCSWRGNDSFELQFNSDGTVNVTKNSDGDVRFTLSVNDYDADLEVNIEESRIYFSNSNLYYDGVNDVKFCINMENMKAGYDNISLYMKNDDLRTSIDPSYYSARKFDNVVYYTLSSKWFKVNSNNPNYSNYSIEVVFSKGGKEIKSTSATIYVQDYDGSKPFQVYGRNLVVNNRATVYKKGVYKIDGKGYDCILDSVSEDGDSILSINKKDDYWEYYANKSGSTSIKCNYHYFKNGKRIDDSSTSIISAIDYENGFCVESEDDVYDKFAGDTVYYYVSYYQFTYDKNGNEQKKEVENPYRCEYDFSSFTDKSVKLTSTMVSASRVRVDIAEDSGEGNVSLNAQLYNSDNEWVGSMSTGFRVHNKPFYWTDLDEVYYNDNEPWNVTVMPYVYEYSKDNRIGKDVSSDYDVSFSCEKADITAVNKNSDGSYTMCNYSGKESESNKITFVWTPKVSGQREELTDWYPINYMGPESNKPKEVKREQSISLIDSETIGFNIYWKTKNIYSWSAKAKVSIEGEPNNSWYVDLVSESGPTTDDEYNHYKSTIKLSPGQMTKNIKVQLIYPGGITVLDEFTTSVASYAQKIINSNDSSYTKYKPLLKAMLNYGAATQNYFGYSTDNLANNFLSASDKIVNDIPKNDIDRYNINKKMHVKGLSYYGTSLVLEGQNQMRHYFKLEAGRDIINYSATIRIKNNSGYSYDNYCTFKKKGDLYYIDTILSEKSLFDIPDIDISDGAVEESFLYSPMNYIAKAYTKGNMDVKLKNLLNAMYWMEKEKSKIE